MTRAPAGRLTGTAFAAIPYWLLDTDLSDRALRLYAVLQSYLNGKDGRAWPSRQTLADRLACSKDSIDRAVRELMDVGAVLVERRTKEGPNGGEVPASNVYIVAFDRPRGPGGVAAPVRPPQPHPSGHGRGTDAATPSRTHADRSKTHVDPDPQIQTKPSAAGASAAKITEQDPVKRHAHRLAVLAMEQPVKPALRGAADNPFPAVMALCERVLRAGKSEQAIRAAIEYGVEVWTLAGLQTAIAQANPRARGGATDAGTAAVLAELNGRRP